MNNLLFFRVLTLFQAPCHFSEEKSGAMSPTPTLRRNVCVRTFLFQQTPSPLLLLRGKGRGEGREQILSYHKDRLQYFFSESDEAMCLEDCVFPRLACCERKLCVYDRSSEIFLFFAVIIL